MTYAQIYRHTERVRQEYMQSDTDIVRVVEVAVVLVVVVVAMVLVVAVSSHYSQSANNQYSHSVNSQTMKYTAISVANPQIFPTVVFCTPPPINALLFE